MARFGENAVVNAIRRGAEEIHSFVTGKPVQELVQTAHEPVKTEASRDHGLSYDHGLAEAARAPKVKSREMEH
jgi:hypothetical protein